MKSIGCPLYKKPFKSDYFILQFFVCLLGIFQGGQCFGLLFGHLFHSLHGIFSGLSGLSVRKQCEKWGHPWSTWEGVTNAQAMRLRICVVKEITQRQWASNLPHAKTDRPRWTSRTKLQTLSVPFFNKPNWNVRFTYFPTPINPHLLSSEFHWQWCSSLWL